MSSHFSELGIEPTSDLVAIKRAYAAKLKTLDTQRDIRAFQLLRDAYESALQHATRARATQACGEAQVASGPTSAIPKQGREPAIRAALPAEPVTVPQVERPIRLLDPRKLAQGIVTELLLATDAEEVERVMRGFPVLETLESLDILSVEIARQLVGNEDLPWRSLVLLSDRLGWNDVQRLRGFDRQLASDLTNWLGRRQLDARLRDDSADPALRKTIAELKQHLRPPLGFYRAFMLGATPGLELDAQLTRFKQAVGREWASLIDSHAGNFMDAFAGRRFQFGIWSGRLLGRSLALGAWFGFMLFVLLSMLRIERPSQWALRGSIAAAALILLAGVVRECLRRMDRGMRRWPLQSGDLIALLIVLGMVAVAVLVGSARG